MLDARRRRSLLLRSFLLPASWNYRTLLGAGLGWALLGGRRRGPPEASPSSEDAVARKAEPFNAHPYLVTVALGALARAEAEGTDSERLRAFRAALRSPLGGLGDGLVWGAWRPVCLVGALLLAALGVPPLVVIGLFLLVYNVVHMGLRVRGLELGAQLGTGVAAGLRRWRIPFWTERIRDGGVLLFGLAAGVFLGGLAGALGPGSGWWLGPLLGFGLGLAGGERLRRGGPWLLILIVLAAGAAGLDPVSAFQAEESVPLSEVKIEERRVHVRNRLGLHARPAAEFVKIASRFQAEIHLSKDGLTVNGKSIMGVLMLAAERGTELVIRGEGPDAPAAVEALGSFVDQAFRES